MSYFDLSKKILYKLQPETAHNCAIFALKAGILPKIRPVLHASLNVELLGLNFTNPVGLAAGFDKNGEAINGLLDQGFGFVEVGTVTPLAQSGNPKPRLFRLTEDEAVINRFGFNNKGVDPFIKNLSKRTKQGIVGANIGKNKTSKDASADYLLLLAKIYGLSDYITINISSPNTPGLRDLQQKDELDLFLQEIASTKEKLIADTGKNIPVLLKLAPDTDDTQRQDIAQIVLKHKINGLIISNTTIAKRDELQSSHANETGGLSGKPLFAISTDMVRHMYQLTEGAVPIIGVGGISSAQDAYSKIKAGASLVQLYSALVYHGFDLVNQINNELIKLLKQDGFDNITQAVGAEAK